MTRRMIGVAMVAVLASVANAAATLGAEQSPEAAERTGWRVPAGADKEASPLDVTEAVLAAGRKLFLNKCQRCHGAAGKGDGPDADARRQRSMDLTQTTRVNANPDGVVFYKIWNGRSSPRMPAFSEELERDEAWSIVAFVQTLREKPPVP